MFAGVRSDYERVLKQRNALLKTAFLAKRSGGGDMRTLDVWDSHLAQNGAELLSARLGLIEDLRPLAGATAERPAWMRESRTFPLLDASGRALLATWKHARNNRLGVSDYVAVGGVAGAVA